MRSILIIGSGIIGLSVAEFLSRTTEDRIAIVSNEHPLSGSFAAAANLATKGQLYARDPHFQIKLDSKKIYSSWVASLLREGGDPFSLDDIFQQGEGCDLFLNETDRDIHLKRVLQSEDELIKRGFELNSIKPIENDKIIYQSEAWVDGLSLIGILKNVLLKRKVHFIHETVGSRNFQNLIKNEKANALIFCTGAWTRELLSKLSFPIPEKMKKQERLTLGSTFYGGNILEQDDKNYVLKELISSHRKNKVTLSGSSSKQYVSSSTVKVQNFDIVRSNFHNPDLEIKNKELLKLACVDSDKFCHLKKSSSVKKTTGIRVGYGHSEFVLEQFYFNEILNIVCTGAHKSGFLLAPMIGEIVSKML